MKSFIEVSKALIEGIDEMVEEGYYNDRTEAVNQAIEEMIQRYKLAKLREKDKRGKKRGSDEKEIV